MQKARFRMLIDLKEINTLKSLKKLGGIQEKMTTKKNEFCQKLELVASQVNLFNYIDRTAVFVRTEF